MNLDNTGTPADVRGTTHGSFESLSYAAQDIKQTLRRSPGWDKLTNQHKEALDLIATKIARILSGDPYFADHWDDIKGYAELGKSK